MKNNEFSARYIFSLILMLYFATTSVVMAKDKINIDEELNKWVGKSADDLLLAFGVPNGAADMPSGGKLLTFIGSEEVGGGGGSNIGSALLGKKGRFLDALDDGSITRYECIVNFSIAPDGLVRGARIQKGDKYCKKFIKAP